MVLAGHVVASPVIENFTSGDEVRYPVVLVRGKLDAGSTALQIQTKIPDGEARDLSGLVDGDRFKALVELLPGENTLELKSGATAESVKFTLRYRPMTTPTHVRLIWLTGTDGDTDFAVPEEGVAQTYKERLSTAALLMQTFTAERMHELGLGRRTFRLEMDAAGKPIVHTVKGKLTGDEYRKTTDDQALWQDTRRFLNETLPDPQAKNIVLMSFTRKDPATGKMQAHTALGGADLGLFGSASMFCWPESIATAQTAFLDSKKVDPSRVHEDSAFRGTYWAVASTTLGATLHEMGHAFGLPHCMDPRCIMTRGFDGFNRFFTFSETLPGQPVTRFTPEQEAWFAPVSATFLRWSPWFEMDPMERADGPRPSVKWDAEAKRLDVRSGAGIKWLGFYQGSDIKGFLVIDDADAREKSFTLEEITKANGGVIPDRIVALDVRGRTGDVSLKP